MGRHRRHPPNKTRQKVKRESLVVRWEDGTENLVYSDEVTTVDGAPVEEGSQVKYFWKPEKKFYNGFVVELVHNLGKVTSEPVTNSQIQEETSGEEVHAVEEPVSDS